MPHCVGLIMGAALSITGLGAMTPVGLSAAASCAALRAGVARLGPVASSQVDAEYGELEPVTGGRVPLEWLNGGPQVEEWPGFDRFDMVPPGPEELFIEDGAPRLISLAVPAAHEAWLASGRTGAPPADWGLFLGLGEGEPEQEVAYAIAAGFPSWRPKVVEVVSGGRASALAALQGAATAISSGRLAGALVGGVDSLIRPTVYDRLSDAGLIKDMDDNPQGILPGEAGAFLTLEAAPVDGRAITHLLSAATANEPTAGTDQPNQGQGLTTAIRSARAAAPQLKDRPLVICDLNGDHYRALEWGLVLIRALGDLRWREGRAPEDEFWHPADCLGDTGAASGLLDCVWAAESLRKGYAGAQHVLVWGASDNELRAAAILGAST